MWVSRVIIAVSLSVLIYGLALAFAEAEPMQPTILPPGVKETVEAAGVATAWANGTPGHE